MTAETQNTKGGFNPRATQVFYAAAGLVAAVAALVGVITVEDIDRAVAVVVALGGVVGAGAPFWAASNVHPGSRSHVTEEDVEGAREWARRAEGEVAEYRRQLADAGLTLNQGPDGQVELQPAPTQGVTTVTTPAADTTDTTAGEYHPGEQ